VAAKNKTSFAAAAQSDLCRRVPAAPRCRLCRDALRETHGEVITFGSPVCGGTGATAGGDRFQLGNDASGDMVVFEFIAARRRTRATLGGNKRKDQGTRT
jgi:hypothetical protein